MNKDWCFEPLKKYGGFIQTEQEYEEVKKIIEENLHKDKNEDKLITIHKTLLEEKDNEIERLNNIIDELEKYIVEEIDDAQEELNIILQGNDLDYKNECTKEFNCIKNALDMLLDKLKELKEGKK